MRIWIGNDHGGVEMKKEIIKLVKDRGHEIHNVGSDSPDIVRYPYFAAEVAASVCRGEADRGILICSTGIGMSIVANKFSGIRASLCTSSYHAKMTRLHNDSNVLCLGGKTTGIDLALDIVSVWLDTPYEAGRHEISLGMVREAETVLLSGSVWKAKSPK